MGRQSRTVRTYRYVGPDGRELKRVETTIKTVDDDGTEKTEVQVSEDPGFPPEARPAGAAGPAGIAPAAGDGGRPMPNGMSRYTPKAPSPASVRIGTPEPAKGGPAAPVAPATDRNVKIKDGKPVDATKRAQSGWGQKEGVVKPAIALQGASYQDIKSKCLARGALWEDDQFPATDKSLYFSGVAPKRFEWKRPPEICSNPQLFVDGATRFDVQQGELGDCWLLAAVASLTCNKSLLFRVVPPDQSFQDGYAGIFHFQFWQYGQWVDVVIDDRLPTYYNKLVFLHSKENNEFWSALLEKAYAKLNGTYEALKGGSQAEAMEDFTGGLTERFTLQQPPAGLLSIMLKAVERGSLMGCAIDGATIEGKGPMGLITGHAYSITGMKMVDIKTARTAGQIPLIRVRNPWGNEAEWTGPWSDKSREWQLISEADRKDIGLTFEDDGEFWMSFQDFCKYFTTLEICSLGPDSMAEALTEGGNKNRWETTQEPGQWVRRVNAGGCRNFLETFWTNPQYRITVTDPDDDDDDNLCTVIIGLMQKDRRKKREEGLDMLTIGYAVYQLKQPLEGQLDLNFFKYNASFAKSPTFINTREVCGRHKFPPGTYVIVPSTFGPGEEADYLVRMYTEKAADSGAVDESTGFNEEAVAVKVPPTDPSVIDKLRETFTKISGEDMEIDAYELRDVLNAAYGQDFKFDGFSIETCRSMVAMMDYDHSGKLGFDEFKKLWDDLRVWKGVFKKFDTDKSGCFNSYELREALRSTGFTLSNAMFKCLVMRFANQEGLIEFDDFVLCAVRLKSMYETFNQAKQAGTAKAVFELDEFVQNGMYS